MAADEESEPSSTQPTVRVSMVSTTTEVPHNLRMPSTLLHRLTLSCPAIEAAPPYCVRWKLSDTLACVLDPAPWSGLVLVERIVEGNRNEVWLGKLGDEPVAIRRSRRPAESLAWELDLMEHLERLGFLVPSVLVSDDGHRSVEGIVVQRWLGGREPSTDSDWGLVAAELGRLHRVTSGYDQRPGCSTVLELSSDEQSVDADLGEMTGDVATRVTAVFEEMVDVPTAVIHGDPMSSNIRIGPDGSVGLLDWDESRVDVTWHDLSNLGIQVLDDDSHRRALRLSNAWEAANGWVVEPEYARRRLEMLTDER